MVVAGADTPLPNAPVEDYEVGPVIPHGSFTLISLVRHSS
jgi:hypothetical protein